MNEIQTGMKYKKEKDQKYPIIYRVPDRKQAIFKAIELARKGDVVITTGKGHEKSMNYGNGEEAWSEHEAVQEAIQRRNRSK
jgi:UDP-N-acetylmuramoyl-L-alanyl-D-glutamate--2,6-diaminopimelate ligase